MAPPDFEELVTGNGIGFTPVGPGLRTATSVKTTPEALRGLAEESVREQFRVVTKAVDQADVLVAGDALQHATRSVAESPVARRDPVLGPWPGPGDLVQTGAWLIDDQRPLSPELEAFLDAGDPPVYFGLGCMRVAPDAAAGSPQLVCRTRTTSTTGAAR